VLGGSSSRRGALTALLSGGLAGAVGLAEAKKKGKSGKSKGQKGKKTRDQASVAAEAADCLSPGPSANLNECNFTNRDFAGHDLSSSSMVGTRFRGADLCGADLRSSQLKNADFRGFADPGRETSLTKADLRSSGCSGIQFNTRTIFCQTRTCTGALNNRDCAAGVAPADVCCGNADCGPARLCQDGACVACDVCLTPGACDFTSVAAAVAAAASGDTILICPGAYRTNVTISNKNLTIVGSGSGPDGTILDGGDVGRVFIFTPADTTLRRLTVTRGRAFGGAGILNSEPTPATAGVLTLEDVHLTGNRATNRGGGITALGTVMIRNSRVTDNVSGVSGGGIDSEATVTLDATTVSGNDSGAGGGIINHKTLHLINGSTVTGNDATGGGPLGTGGGINNRPGATVTLSADSSVTANEPDNCTGAAAC
jgi:uncharacterized protein YjbI with pentapeptide repeats